ncbi:MAG: HAD family phosphatase [Spirochaetia bacterium]|nr:HAD family phosphatase [Spirochaetia bacterium]
MTSASPIRAILFDMDGVIVSTQEQHARSEHLAFLEFGLDIAPAEITRRYAGFVDRALFADGLRTSGKDHSPETIDRITSLKWKLMDRIVQNEGLALIPGALELILAFRNDGLPLAIASSSPMSFIDRVMEHCLIGEYFKALTSGHEVKHGKPAPDIFLLAASRLGARPEECLVIEDARSGMQGAKSANMFCLGLWPKSSGECPADLTVESFEGLNHRRLLDELVKAKK